MICLQSTWRNLLKQLKKKPDNTIKWGTQPTNVLQDAQPQQWSRKCKSCTMMCVTPIGKKIQSENSKCWRICGEQWECLCTAGGSKNCYSLLENNTARSNLKICSPFDLAISLPIYPREIFPHMHQEYFTKKYLQHQYLKEPQVETTQMSPTNKMEKYILVYH